MVLEKTLESPLDCREVQPVHPKDQSWVFIERLMLKLKLQYFGHVIQRTNTLEKTLMLEKTEGGRRRGRQRMQWLDGITDLMDMGLRNSRSWYWQGGLACCSPWGRKESDMTERLSCTELTENYIQPRRQLLKQL